MATPMAAASTAGCHTPMFLFAPASGNRCVSGERPPSRESCWTIAMTRLASKGVSPPRQAPATNLLRRSGVRMAAGPPCSWVETSNAKPSRAAATDDSWFSAPIRAERAGSGNSLAPAPIRRVGGYERELWTRVTTIQHTPAPTICHKFRIFHEQRFGFIVRVTTLGGRSRLKPHFGHRSILTPRARPHSRSRVTVAGGGGACDYRP